MEIENPAVGSLSIFLVLLFQPHNPKTLCKLRRTWYKIAKIDRIKSAHLQPDRHFLASHVQHAPGMPITTYTSDSDADIPFPPDAAVLSFSRSGSGWLTMDASWPTFSSVDCWLIYEQRIWKLETRFDKCKFMGRKVSTPSSVDYMPNISTDTRTPIDGNKLTVTGTGGVYFKSQT